MGSLLNIMSGIISWSLVNFGYLYRSSWIVHEIGRRVLDKKLPKGLELFPDYEQLSPLVTRIMGLNPGSHTLQGTNTFLVGTGKKRILIDTGEGKDGYIPALKSAMGKLGCDGIDYILITHAHYDHTGGIKDVMNTFGASIISYKRIVDPNNLDSTLMETKDKLKHVEDGHIFETEGASLKTIYTPGHTDDHLSFILEEENALFSGDCILGGGSTSVFDDLHDYMLSLKKLLSLANASTRKSPLNKIYPGHGPTIESTLNKECEVNAVIKNYIEHRSLREEQILDVFEALEGSKISSLAIANRVYGNLPLPIMVSAQYNVSHHLSKLQKEGIVKAHALDLWSYLPSKKRD